MTLLTPELIEKAAKADWECNRLHPAWEDLSEPEREGWLNGARAALIAVIPDVVASCAAVADIAGDVAIAAEIRSLIPQEGK